MFHVRSRLFCSLSFMVVACSSKGQSVPQSSESNPLRLSGHHVTASVADLNKEADWYERVLGFSKSKLLGDTADFKMYQMTMPGYRIDLVWQNGSSRQHERKGALEQGWLHVVFETADLNAAYQCLLAKGTDVKANRDTKSHLVHLTLHDPEGNEIGIAHE